jgi:uncharacterized phage protein gp47/JayE
LGVPPGQVWSIVEGDTEANIIEQISEHVAGGIGVFGAISAVYNDPVTGYAETIKYSRPTLKNIWITVNLTTNSKYPGDGDDQIKTKLIAYFTENQKLGTDVVNSRLYSVVNEVPGHSINSIYMGVSASPTSEADLSVTINEKAVTDATRIVVS